MAIVVLGYSQVAYYRLTAVSRAVNLKTVGTLENTARL